MTPSVAAPGDTQPNDATEQCVGNRAMFPIPVSTVEAVAKQWGFGGGLQRPLIVRAGLTMVPNVPWHRAPRRKGPPRHQEKNRLFNCHLYREPIYGYSLRNTLRYVHGLLGIYYTRATSVIASQK